MYPRNRGFAENLVGSGFLWSVSYTKTIPVVLTADVFQFFTKKQSQPTKNYVLWVKSGPNATFTQIFLGLSWPWVGEFVGFIIIFTCLPTQQN